MNTHTDRPDGALARHHRMPHRYLTALVAAAPLIACTKGDKVPAYVEIPAVTMTTTSGQGGATSKITDAWVTVDERLIGVWELPARIPVLGEGRQVIGVTPAIKRNGAFDDRLRYPFYRTWSAEVELRREGTTAIAPTTSYIDQALVWQEGFEDPFSLITAAPGSQVQLQRFTPATNPELVFLENSPCAGLLLDATNRYARIETDEDFVSYGGPTFLELDHRSDLLITVGIKYVASGIVRSEPFIYLPPTHRSDGTMPWNKVYVDLSPLFNTAVSQRDIFIEAELPASRSEARIYLDNIKLLRLQP